MERSVPPLSHVKVTGSAIDNHAVLVRPRPLDEANLFGFSVDDRDFKHVDTSTRSAVFIDRSFSVTDQRKRAMRLGFGCEVADEAWESVRDGETAHRGPLGRQPIDDAVDSVGGWLGDNGALTAGQAPAGVETRAVCGFRQSL